MAASGRGDGGEARPSPRQAELQWSLGGALDEIEAIDKTNNRSFVFILGAGASVASGISSGSDLAETWLKEIHRQRTGSTEREFVEWVASGASGIAGLTLDRIGEFYPQIFEQRFRGDPESGYAYLENAMDGREPSLGYSLLAEVMNRTRHKIVITTNFDNLVADALAIHAQKPAIMVGHESLAGFVRPNPRRPLVAKIHRDLLFSPKSDSQGVGKLDNAWSEALQRLFQLYTPIVIGYGGNDGSLMGLLENLPKQTISGRMLWCIRKGTAPNERVQKVLKHHDGVAVEISGFDDFMLRFTPRVLRAFDLSNVSDRVERLGRRRAERYREQAEKLIKVSPSSTSAEPKPPLTLSELLKDERNWWTWEMRASAEPDPDRRRDIYLHALEKLPDSGILLCHYARFLAENGGARKECESLFELAMRKSPADWGIVCDYAEFVEDDKEAERVFRRALKTSQRNAHVLQRYALFLADRKRDKEQAHQVFAEALRCDPSNATLIGSFARFLVSQCGEVTRAGEMYLEALSFDPLNAEVLGNYAYYLERDLKDDERAERNYLESHRISRDQSRTLSNYGVFLLRRSKNKQGAEAHFREAMQLLPDDSANIGNFVAFVLNHGSGEDDLTEATAAQAKATREDPGNANNHANTAAILLHGERYEEGRAEAALAIDLLRRLPVTQSLCEALFYMLVCENDPDQAGEWLGKIKYALQAGFNRVYWDFDFLLTPERLERRCPAAEADLLRAVAAAIIDATPLVSLNRFERWSRVAALNPFSTKEEPRSGEAFPLRKTAAAAGAPARIADKRPRAPARRPRP